MRILMVSDVPLRPELGAGRPQFELARELRKLGHVVETFDRADAFGGNERRPSDRFRPLRFAGCARSYVRRHGAGFDVIDAAQGNLPFPRRSLRYDGLVVARSAGLFAFYDDYRRREEKLWSERLPGSRLGQRIYRWRYRRAFAAERRSFEECDLAIFPNAEEEEYARRFVRPGRRSVTIPLGLADELAEALVAHARPPAERLAAKRVAFIGSWTLRKGTADWPEIVDEVRQRVPTATFAFLGTGADRATVLRDIGSDEGIEVVPSFPAGELPRLLGEVTVGAVPSYVEAGPFSVLEFLGAGVPAVAYDAPGARALVPDRDLLVPLGNAGAFGRALADLLSLDEDAYTRLSECGLAASTRYRWSDIARRTLDAYAGAT